MVKRRRANKKPGFFGRAFRSLFSIVILSAFVIGIALFVRELSDVNSGIISRFATPLLSQLGLSGDAAGDVAGDFVQRVSQTKLSTQNKQSIQDTVNAEENYNSNDNRTLLFSVGLIADTGDENEMLRKAIGQAEAAGAEYIIHLGDLTAWGDMKSLLAARDVLNTATVNWYVIPGDHDLAESVGRNNFTQVFGEPNESVTINGKNILLFDNSANFTPIESASLNWLTAELKEADIVILSQPIYHPVNPRVMGMFEGVEDTEVRAQANFMLKEIQNSGVTAIIAADHHKSSESPDPVRSSLTHYVVGAAAVDRNLQRPRFSMLKVFANGEVEVDDVVIE